MRTKPPAAAPNHPSLCFLYPALPCTAFLRAPTGMQTLLQWLIKRTDACFPRINSKGRTALHYAASLGQTQLLAWLLQSGYYRWAGGWGEKCRGEGGWVASPIRAPEQMPARPVVCSSSILPHLSWRSR